MASSSIKELTTCLHKGCKHPFWVAALTGLCRTHHEISLVGEAALNQGKCPFIRYTHHEVELTQAKWSRGVFSDEDMTKHFSACQKPVMVEEGQKLNFCENCLPMARRLGLPIRQKMEFSSHFIRERNIVLSKRLDDLEKKAAQYRSDAQHFHDLHKKEEKDYAELCAQFTALQAEMAQLKAINAANQQLFEQNTTEITQLRYELTRVNEKNRRWREADTNPEYIRKRYLEMTATESSYVPATQPPYVPATTYLPPSDPRKRPRM